MICSIDDVLCVMYVAYYMYTQLYNAYDNTNNSNSNTTNNSDMIWKPSSSSAPSAAPAALNTIQYNIV